MADQEEETGVVKTENIEIEPQPSGISSVAMRVSDPYGIALQRPDGGCTEHARGEVIHVSAEVAKKLFMEGKAVPEEKREPGMPAFLERR